MCISSHNSNQPLHRSGFTLVELLIVMGIIVLLAAITLPSFKTLITSDKVNSASRVIKAQFEAARGRAIASGRPVAVILARQDPTGGDQNRLNTVLSLSTGSVFPAYTGDVTSAQATIVNDTSVTVSTAEASLLGATPSVFGPGDLVRFDNAGPLLPIVLITSSGTTATIAFSNPPMSGSSNLQERYPLMGKGKASFQIYRAPTRSFEAPTVFPKGTCIDLSVSGFGTSGTDLRATGASGEVMVIFSSTGKVESVIYGNNRVSPSGLIHLMLGRVEQVDLNDPAPVANPADPSTFNANLNDPENVWLTINPFSGAVYTTQNYPGSETAAVATRLPLARTYATNAINRVEN